MRLFKRGNKQVPEILSADRLLLVEPVYADQDRLDPPDPGSMVDEHKGVPREVAIKALHDLGELSVLGIDSPERTTKLVVIALSMYPIPSDNPVNL